MIRRDEHWRWWFFFCFVHFTFCWWIPNRLPRRRRYANKWSSTWDWSRWNRRGKRRENICQCRTAWIRTICWDLYPAVSWRPWLLRRSSVRWWSYCCCWRRPDNRQTTALDDRNSFRVSASLSRADPSGISPPIYWWQLLKFSYTWTGIERTTAMSNNSPYRKMMNILAKKQKNKKQKTTNKKVDGRREEVAVASSMKDISISSATFPC